MRTRESGSETPVEREARERSLARKVVQITLRYERYEDGWWRVYFTIPGGPQRYGCRSRVLALAENDVLDLLDKLLGKCEYTLTHHTSQWTGGPNR